MKSPKIKSLHKKKTEKQEKRKQVKDIEQKLEDIKLKLSMEITEKQKLEEALRKIKEIDSSILSAISHAVIGLKERVIYFANESVEKVFGWKPQELIGKKTRILYRNDEEYEEIARIFYPVLEKQRTHIEEFPCRRKDGKDIICKISASVIGKEMKDKGIVVVYEDITESKKIEKALQESEKKYIDLYQNAPDGYHSIGPDGTIIEVNDTWLKMLGYKRDEVVNKIKLYDLLTDSGRRIFNETFSKLKKKGSIENIEYTLRRKDGIKLPVSINATAIFDENGNFIKSRAIIRDNSEKKFFEQKLQKSAHEWRSTFDSMPYGILLIDTDLTIKRANIAVSGLFGKQFEEIIGRKCYEFFSVSDELKGYCHKIFKKEVPPGTLEYYEKNLNKYMMIYAAPVTDEKGSINAIVISLVDITNLKDKEKQLTESRNAFLNMLKETDASYKQFQVMYDALIHSFVNAIDAKSPWTKGHSERVTYYALEIAKTMGLKQKEIDKLRIAALLHDIGKIGTYDVILDKPGKLTEEESELIRMHPVKGAEILRPVTQMKDLLPIIRHHHERMDGKGYPDGLKGEEIPLMSRIIALADSYDSMTSDRPYRPAPPREYAVSEIQRCSGTQFDPQAAEAFLKVLARGK